MVIGVVRYDELNIYVKEKFSTSPLLPLSTSLSCLLNDGIIMKQTKLYNTE